MTTLKELIRVGANVNAKDNNDSTPLHLAAYSLFDFKGKYFMSLHKETILKSNLENSKSLSIKFGIDFVI